MCAFPFVINSSRNRWKEKPQRDFFVVATRFFSAFYVNFFVPFFLCHLVKNSADIQEATTTRVNEKLLHSLCDRCLAWMEITYNESVKKERTKCKKCVNSYLVTLNVIRLLPWALRKTLWKLKTFTTALLWTHWK
jgi:hypothetical protein